MIHTPDHSLFHCLLRLASFQRENLDRPALQDALQTVQAQSQQADRQLAVLARYFGWTEPQWFKPVDADCGPLLAQSPEGRWCLVLGRDAHGQCLLLRWDEAARRWQEDTEARLDDWQLAHLRLGSRSDQGRTGWGQVMHEWLSHRRGLLESALVGLLIGLVAGQLVSVLLMPSHHRVMPTAGVQALWLLSLGTLLLTVLESLLHQASPARYGELLNALRRCGARVLHPRLPVLPVGEWPGRVGRLAARLSGYEAARACLAQAGGRLLIDLPFALMFLACIVWIGGALALVPLCCCVVAVLLTRFMRQRMSGLRLAMAALRAMPRRGLAIPGLSGLSSA